MRGGTEGRHASMQKEAAAKQTIRYESAQKRHGLASAYGDGCRSFVRSFGRVCSEAPESAEGNALAAWKKRSPSKCGKLAKLGKKLGEGEEGNTSGQAVATRRPWPDGGQNAGTAEAGWAG